jgi:peptidoglycan hydrolase CwlO-like protein
MDIQLIQGEFNPKDALELLTQMIHIKIKYHENKIVNNSTEEDIKSRESKIKKLQKELYELRENINSKNKSYLIEGTIKID